VGRGLPGGVAGGSKHRLILDEPTFVLAPLQVEQLFKTLQHLVDEGCAVHRLEEVLEVTDRITVLHDGHVVGTVLSVSP
jgi:ABC-type uncharacterized transport system ATPase subunit